MDFFFFLHYRALNLGHSLSPLLYSWGYQEKLLIDLETGEITGYPLSGELGTAW